MDGSAVLIISLLVLAFGLISKRLQGGSITPPMAFTAFGMILGAPAVDLIDLDASSGAVDIFAELTLVLVLFTDAARIDLAVLRRNYHLPLRLLAIGMPLSIALGTAVALVVFPSFSFFEAALLAAILAPTDAALGQSVVSNPRVPMRIRQALNVESGLNDGIALPIVLVLAACAEVAAGHQMTSWLWVTAKQLILGPVVGIAVGYLGGSAVDRASRAGWMNHRFGQLAGLSLALLAFTGAQQIGGNGFIAAFVAGLTLGTTSRPFCQRFDDFTETEGQLLSLITFFLVGALLVWPAGPHWNWQVIIYAISSLTVVRLIPVALSLINVGLHPITTAFLGWFGPRGLASILFAMIVVERAEIPNREVIFVAAIATTLLSIYAHGITAAPASRHYAGRLARLGERAEIPELVDVAELPPRISHDVG